MSRCFSFPAVVNETAVRVTASGVAILAALAVVLRRPELLIVLAFGFCARVLSGPRFSPLALLATRVVAPRLSPEPRLVPGPPKRFAQGLGAAASLTAVGCYYGGWHTAAFALAGLMVLLSSLEAAVRICIGCLIHSWLVRRGLLHSVDCAECADVTLRRPTKNPAPSLR